LTAKQQQKIEENLKFQSEKEAKLATAKQNLNYLVDYKKREFEKRQEMTELKRKKIEEEREKAKIEALKKAEIKALEIKKVQELNQMYEER
jgi:hypothetical protein